MTGIVSQGEVLFYVNIQNHSVVCRASNNFWRSTGVKITLQLCNFQSDFAVVIWVVWTSREGIGKYQLYANTDEHFK